MTTGLSDPNNHTNAPGAGPLRPGGSALAFTPSDKPDSPATRSAASERQQEDVTLVRDLWGGTRRMREQSVVYLPKSPGEEPANYSARLAKAVLFNAFRRTVSGLTGFVFAKDPKLGEDVPLQFVEHAENIDNAGTHLDVFLRDQLQDALQTGHNAILVDFPQTGGTQTAADESNGIRPYWVPIKKENIISWRTTTENGGIVLTQLVLRECSSEAKGAYGEEEVTRYRVFQRSPERVVSFQLLRLVKTPTGESFVLEAEGDYPTQEEIPVAEVTTSGKKGLFESDPPLLDLAFLNVAHYQERSDYAYSKHMTCVPILTLLGFDQEADANGNKKKIVVGPNAAVVSSNPDAKVGYTTHSGEALGEVRSSLEELKSEMGTLGLSMLAPQKRSAETAEAKRLDKQTESSDLAVTARGLQDGVERAMHFHARYLLLDDGGSIEINRNFEPDVLDPAMVTAYVTLARDLGLPLRVVLQELKQGGVISEAEDLEQLEAEMLANAAAIQEQKRLEAEERERQFRESGGQPPIDRAT